MLLCSFVSVYFFIRLQGASSSPESSVSLSSPSEATEVRSVSGQDETLRMVVVVVEVLSDRRAVRLLVARGSAMKILRSEMRVLVDRVVRLMLAL